MIGYNKLAYSKLCIALSSVPWGTEVTKPRSNITPASPFSHLLDYNEEKNVVMC